jgi:hypothetical protein
MPEPATRCEASPREEGVSALGQVGGARHADLLVLELRLEDGARTWFTSAPNVTTDLGSVVDVAGEGDRARVEIRLSLSGSVSGSVVVRGTLSGRFDDDVDRCPYERTLWVRATDTTVTIR